MLDVIGLKKGFGPRTLFSGASFRLERGDRMALVGPNGAGKSTLLRIVMGLEQADDGQVSLRREARLGYLPQEVATHAAGAVIERVLSGASEVKSLERELAQIEAELESADADTAILLSQRHAELYTEYSHRDGHTLTGRARDILKGLGFSEAQMDAPLASLSGGWVMRAELARLLLAHPDVLLLDEPTNHLDLESLAWLEGYLAEYTGATLVISHDRYFLNRLVTSIAELSPDGVFVFPGDYDDYLEARQELEERFQKEQAARDRRAAELRGFIERFGAKNTKATQAQSRRKMLARLEKGAPAPPPKKQRKKIRISLPEPPRSGEVALTLRGVRKAYGEKVVYDGLSLVLKRGERVALIGENGAGKSTMLKLLAGVFPPDAGERQLGHNVEPYYFAQHQADSLDPSHTVLEELWQLIPQEPTTRVRGILGAFLFSGDDVDKRISVLSGGEKSRLALAKMLAKPTNLLLLDEPTNHLDLASRDVLEAALASYPGTVCFISHDRYFIDRIATRILAITPGGGVTEYLGDFAYYEWKRAQEAPVRAAEAAPERQGPSLRAIEREQKKAADRDQKKRAKEAARLESEIQRMEGRIKEIDQLMCDPGVYADAARCKELLNERTDLDQALAPLYSQWEDAAG